uniref:Protein pitchfork-like n=1 Tax=Actinia tenebrosa TaxID=6105 RepID=A0A6P8J2P6_ACTTE
MFSLFPSETSQNNVSFGTTMDRPMLPLKIPPTRFGNEMFSGGSPHIGPGSYDNAEVSAFVYEMEQKPVCNRGYSLGARTAERFPKPSHMDVPGPPTHQPIVSKPVEFDPDFKPFLVGSTRFPEISKSNVVQEPGAGTYEHDIPTNRKMKYHGSFGGPQTLITSVKIKCNDFGEKDICNTCKNNPIGDYYEYKKKHFCRKCYNQHLESQKKYPKSYLMKFYKVRDCSLIHDHEGTNARLMLKSEKDIKKQRYREAYMSLYF